MIIRGHSTISIHHSSHRKTNERNQRRKSTRTHFTIAISEKPIHITSINSPPFETPLIEPDLAKVSYSRCLLSPADSVVNSASTRAHLCVPRLPSSQAPQWMPAARAAARCVIGGCSDSDSLVSMPTKQQARERRNTTWLAHGKNGIEEEKTSQVTTPSWLNYTILASV